MSDWHALFQTFLASGLASGVVRGILMFLFKIYAEKRIEHIFDVRLKEYEAWLQRASELQIQIGKDRVEEYKKLSALIMTVRKHGVDLVKNKDPTADEISTVVAKIKDLEKVIYDLSFTLLFDDIFQRIHSYKVELLTLVKNVENEKKLRSNGQTQRTDGVGEIINRSITEIQGECKAIVDMLKKTIIHDITKMQEAQGNAV